MSSAIALLWPRYRSGIKKTVRRTWKLILTVNENGRPSSTRMINAIYGGGDESSSAARVDHHCFVRNDRLSSSPAAPYASAI